MYGVGVNRNETKHKLTRAKGLEYMYVLNYNYVVGLYVISILSVFCFVGSHGQDSVDTLIPCLLEVITVIQLACSWLQVALAI